ncbi:hypothetical protein QOT17_011819 [Balamuthia mandrillaris]
MHHHRSQHHFQRAFTTATTTRRPWLLWKCIVPMAVSLILLTVLIHRRMYDTTRNMHAIEELSPPPAPPSYAITRAEIERQLQREIERRDREEELVPPARVSVSPALPPVPVLDREARCRQVQPWMEDYLLLHREIRTGKRPPKYAVYQCGSSLCGGYGDRVTGMISVFLYAILTDRAFMVDWAKPVDITEYFDSPMDWRWSSSSSYSVKTMNQIDIRDLEAQRQYQHSALSEEKAQVVIFHTNIAWYQELLRSPKLAERLRNKLGVQDGWEASWNAEFWGCLLTHLLKPSPALQQEVDKVKKQMGTHFNIGIQVRTGGAWDRERLKGESLDSFWQCATHLADQLLSWHQTHSSSSEEINYKFYVTGDAESVITAAKAALGKDKVVALTGSITHTEKSSPAAAREGMMRTLTDVWMLGETNLTIGTTSNFARVGTYRSLRPLAYMLPAARTKGYLECDVSYAWKSFINFPGSRFRWPKDTPDELCDPAKMHCPGNRRVQNSQ